MSEEPLFDPLLKKRKKKAVAFSEDPLGADADPTAPAPTTIDPVTMTGEHVNMGPTTSHEAAAEEAAADDEFKAIFSDVKKKKKKKAIPMDFDDSGTSTPTAAPAGGEDLDFSDLKKKKKSSKKKVAIDLEEFERQLGEKKVQLAEGDEDDDDDEEGEQNLDHLEEADLGDDPFA
ncbi:hypothetical protein FISHEDRAFT_15255, partial [Fistulina hepatica ATCC 64428]